MNKTPQEIIDRRKELWNLNQDIEKDKEYTEAIAKYITSPEGKHIRDEVSIKPEIIIEMFFVLVDKDQNTVPFFLNGVQRSFIDDLNQASIDYKKGKRNHLKFLIVKGRQQGFSQAISGYILACSLFKRNFSGYTLADNADNTQVLFEDKAKFPLSNLPSKLVPVEKFNNKRELHFSKLNSRWRIATAGNKDVGRSKTINFFHGSEVAFWSDMTNTLTGLSEAFTKNAIVVLETTANGYNEYKKICDEAKQGLNNFELKFYEWWLTPEYRFNFESTTIEDGFKYDVFNNKAWIYERCKWLIEFVKLDWNQVYWYYSKWRDRKEYIKQEYPCTVDEAFLASGRNVFDKEILIMRKEYLKRLYKENPPLKGSFSFQWVNPMSKDKIMDDTIKFIPDNHGYITIYEDVKKGYPYVIGGDTKGEGRDFYSATVKNNATGNRCATLHANLDADVYTHQVYCLAKYYNTALIGIEINFNTYPVTELQRLGYFKQYVREKQDTFTGELEKKFGWKTDGNTREPMITKEIALIRDNIELFNDITFLDECLTFVYDKKNRPDAESGSHDDVLISDMISNEIGSQQTSIIKVEQNNVIDNSPEARALRHLNNLTNNKSNKGRKGVVL